MLYQLSYASMSFLTQPGGEVRTVFRSLGNARENVTALDKNITVGAS
jgi:hypothetical protein